MGLLNLGVTTVNNASGTVTPNFLLVGMYEYHQTGTLHVNAPLNTPDGGVFAIRIQQDVNDPGWPVTWDSFYKQGDASLCDGYLTQGGSKDVFFLATNGHAVALAGGLNI